jgi:DNA gyrase/topoisomerase IV subunit A
MKVLKEEYNELVDTYDDLYQATVCKERQLPDIRDGMRIVQRRLYWVFLSMPKEKRFKLNKSASIVGDTIKLHCHGDSSIYDSLVNEVNSVSNLLKGKGNWGCRSSSVPSKPAKMRYTEVALLKKSENFFKYAPYAIMVDGENNEKEPQYIPVPVPLSLLGGFYGISKAGKTYIPPYKISDLIKRLKWLLMDSKSGKGPIIKPYFGLKLESDGAFESVLTTGSGDIDVYPILDINEKKEEIVVRGYCPELTSLGKKLEKLSECEKYGKYIDIVDLSSKKDEIIISYKTKYMKNVDISFKSLCDHVKKELTHTLRCKIITYRDFRDFPVVSVDDWLLSNFEQLKYFREQELKIEIASLENKVKLNEAILLVRPVIRDYLNKYKVFTKSIIEELKEKCLKILNNDKELNNKIFQISIIRLLDCETDNESLTKKIKLLKSMINETSIKENLLHWMDELSKEFKE